MQMSHSHCPIADKSRCLGAPTPAFDARCSVRRSSQTNPAACALLSLCSSVQKEAGDCKDLLDAFQACVKTLSEGS